MSRIYTQDQGAEEVNMVMELAFEYVEWGLETWMKDLLGTKTKSQYN